MQLKTAVTPRRHATRKTTALALATVLAFCGAAALNASAATAAANSFATIAHSTMLRQGDALIGALPMSQPIHIEVALKLRNRNGLDAYIANNAKSRAGDATPQFMTPDQFLANHAPTQLQAQSVADYLTGMGFRNVIIAPNRLLVSADGTAASARNAFMTSFAQIRTHDGRIAFANTDDVRIPAALSDKVLAVLGLQSVHQAHAFAQRMQPDSAHTDTITAHLPTELAAIYDATNPDLVASDVAIGIITSGSLTQVRSDLNTFTANLGLPTVVTQTINTNGTSSDTSGTGEWDLDSQTIVGLAGGQVGKLVFYDVPSATNANLVADFNAVVAANKVKIIAVSMGECETDAGPTGDGSAAAADAIFAAGAAQGQNFSVATGDHGADECGDGGTTPSWPANSQYVIAVAGTRLDASSTTWSSETVWNTLAGSPAGATGGSQSTYEPKPSWQTLWTGTLRGVADVAFDGNPNSGALIIVNGKQQKWGGTGLAASIFAGAWARVLHNYPTFGFAGPALYAMQADIFHDVTSGNNAGSTAHAGYDLASGRGSMEIDNIGDAIFFQGLGHKPPIANFDYSSTGLTAHFTDQSVASDGAWVMPVSWKFGDGSTSTLASPSHTYAANGTYSVIETVRDGVGAKATKTLLVTVNSSGVLQLLGNTGFETATAPWILSGNISIPCNSTAYHAHQGNCLALLDANVTPSGNAYLSQTVPIPSGKSSATLSFSLLIGSGNTTSKLRVQVLDPAGAVLGTLATYTSLDTTNAYVTRTLDMTPYIGQTVKLRFYAADGAFPYSPLFQIDDVTLTVQ